MRRARARHLAVAARRPVALRPRPAPPSSAPAARAPLSSGASPPRQGQRRPQPRPPSCPADEDTHPSAPIRPARLPAARSVTHASACRLRAGQPHRPRTLLSPQLR